MTPSNTGNGTWAWALARMAICATAIALHLPSLIHPVLLFDDFHILLASWTWADTRANLWVPMNEHSWPLTRLLTAVVVEASGHRQTWLPLAAAVPPRLALLAAMLLLDRFLARRTGSPLAGLVGMTTFGVTANYHEALYWYAAHPPLWSVCCALLGLMAADRWAARGRWWRLAESAVWAFVAPAWFAGGVLVGPLVGASLAMGGTRRAAAVPLLGTAAFLAAAGWFAGAAIGSPSHFRGESLANSLAPAAGAKMAAWAVPDQLLLGAIGASEIALPFPVAMACLATAVAVTAWWCWRAADRRLVVLGVGLVWMNYWLIYSARAGWSYPDQLRDWSRYNVFPQFGLALVVAGGRWTTAEPRRRTLACLAAVAAVLFLVHSPRGLRGGGWTDSTQAADFRELERVDAACRRRGISAAAARAALGVEGKPYWPWANRWLLLWGSDTPVDLPPDEVRAVLVPEVAK